ncbi:MAG: YCF48-related protein [Sterolibacterium sp.]
MYTNSRRNLIRTIFLGALIGIFAPSSPTWAESKFQDPLDTPALMRNAVNTRPLMAIAHAGAHLVAVGSRGLIVRSEDQGKTWTQSAVPVQCDLLAVHFPTPQLGWVVGHDGVILHSSDGGKNWTKQFDGRIADGAFKKYYAAATTDAAMTAAAAQVAQNFKAGPALPYLDVWFEDTEKGFVVGSFGMLAATVDGGKTWEPWLHRIDNAQGVNLNSIRNVGGNIYIVGERGILFKLDRANRRFQKMETGYAGSFFGIVGNTDALVAFGLRGIAYRSGNGGANWEALKMPVDATITAGVVSRESANIVLVTSADQILLGDAQGRSFKLVHPHKPMRYTGIALVDRGTAVVTGLDGVRTETLSQ